MREIAIKASALPAYNDVGAQVSEILAVPAFVRPHLLQIQKLRENSRTCFEGPFGEVIRATGPMAKANPFRFSTKYQDDETDLVMYPARPYSLSTGRWANRDPIEERGGPNLYGFVGNDPIQFIDPFGFKWKVMRVRGERAAATCECGDTWDDLARKIHFDTSDYTTWAQTTDQKPVPGKPYLIPNVIYVDNGDSKSSDQWPTSIIYIWRSMLQANKLRWEQRGFRVLWDEGVTDNDIKTHLGSLNIYGYVFVGHGYDGGIINSYNHNGPELSGLGPERYTHYGIAFLTLDSCDSAYKVPIIHRHYKFNAWESNVSTRGWFVGYEGSVNTLNEVFEWVATPGKNDQPFQPDN